MPNRHTRAVPQLAEDQHQQLERWRRRRSMARASGLSPSTIGRIWRAFGLKPHRSEHFKLPTDPQFIKKVRDVVGLYLNPPEKAVVLCVDEKSQIQALDRTQPLLPLRPGLPGRCTHDYRRHGTTSLFAAFDTATGEVIGRCYKKHRAVEYRKFLAVIDKAMPPDVEAHLVLDNYSTHKTELIHKWLLKHPRYHFHFTPTSSSWISQVERWFAEITRQLSEHPGPRGGDQGIHRSLQRESQALHLDETDR